METARRQKTRRDVKNRVRRRAAGTLSLDSTSMRGADCRIGRASCPERSSCAARASAPGREIRVESNVRSVDCERRRRRRNCDDGTRYCVVPNRFARSSPTAPTCPDSLDISVTLPPGPVMYEHAESSLLVADRAMSLESDEDERSWQRAPGRYGLFHRLTSCRSIVASRSDDVATRSDDATPHSDGATR